MFLGKKCVINFSFPETKSKKRKNKNPTPSLVPKQNCKTGFLLIDERIILQTGDEEYPCFKVCYIPVGVLKLSVFLNMNMNVNSL